MSALALPAPSLQRHLERTIDGRSLTGCKDAYTAPTRSDLARLRARRRSEQEWRIEQRSRVSVHIHALGVTKASLFCCSSIHYDTLGDGGEISHVTTWQAALDERHAKALHRRSAHEGGVLYRERGITVLKIGGVVS